MPKNVPYAIALTVLDKHQPHEDCDGLERHHCSALVQFVRYFLDGDDIEGCGDVGKSAEEEGD